jgi:hypothetical protein
MKGYKEAFYPPPPNHDLDPDENRDQDGNINFDFDMDMDVDPDAEVEAEADHGSPVRRSSEPLFDPVAEDVDLDEMAAMEEMEREQGQASGRDGVSARSNGRGDENGAGHAGGDGGGPPPMDDEEEWEGLYD